MLDHPLVRLLVLAMLSLTAAILLFLLGDSFAEVTQATPGVGFSFKAGGALAGFLIIFRVLQKQLARSVPVTKLHLEGAPSFDRRGTYRCAYEIFNDENGERRHVTVKPRWEAGFLTIDVRDVGHNDLIAIEVMAEGDGSVWTCDFFPPRARVHELKSEQEDS